MSGAGPAVVGFLLLRSCAFVVFSAAAPNIAEPPKGFSSPSWAVSERLFATYASWKTVLNTVQVCWSSRSFDHSRVSVSYSPDWSSNFSATTYIYSSRMTSFYRLDFFCATSIALMYCGIPSASLLWFFITWGICTASTVCSPEQNLVRWLRSLRAVTFV